MIIGTRMFHYVTCKSYYAINVVRFHVIVLSDDGGKKVNQGEAFVDCHRYKGSHYVIMRSIILLTLFECWL